MNRRLALAILDFLTPGRRPTTPLEVWQTFNERDWNRSIGWLDRSGLSLYFWDAVKSAGAQDLLPAHVQAHLENSKEQNATRIFVLSREFTRLNALFSSAGIRYAALKGFTLAPDYCPNPNLRAQYDHDYLIHPNCLSQAESVLLASGYSRKASRESHSFNYLLQNHARGAKSGPLGPFSPQLTAPVEFHTSLWESAQDRIRIESQEECFSHLIERQWNGAAYSTLCEEDALAFQALHVFRHILHNWCRLSLFLEIAHFLNFRSTDSLFWKRFSERIRQVSWLPEISALVFGLSADLFGASTPAEIRDQARRSTLPILDLWIQRYGRLSALDNFSSNKFSLFLHREFVLDPRAWAGIRRQRLLPPHRPHRIPAALKPPHESTLRKVLSRLSYSIQRTLLHGRSALRYALEYPQWIFLRKRHLQVRARDDAGRPVGTRDQRHPIRDCYRRAD